MVVKKTERIRSHGGGPPSAPEMHPRPVFAKCFKDLGLPEISAARFAKCFKDLLARRCPRDLRRPVFDECFKDLGLPEISAAR